MQRLYAAHHRNATVQIGKEMVPFDGKCKSAPVDDQTADIALQVPGFSLVDPLDDMDDDDLEEEAGGPDQEEEEGEATVRILRIDLSKDRVWEIDPTDADQIRQAITDLQEMLTLLSPAPEPEATTEPPAIVVSETIAGEGEKADTPSPETTAPQGEGANSETAPPADTAPPAVTAPEPAPAKSGRGQGRGSAAKPPKTNEG